MFKLFLICIFFLNLNAQISKTTSNTRKQQQNNYAILIKDLTTNQIIYQKNIKNVLPLASLTKIMTTIIVLEKMKQQKLFFISKIKVPTFVNKIEKSKIGLIPNDMITIDDLLKATLIGSSNDATETLADYFSNGNRQEFVKEMNIKAKEIGMKNTVFTNASGFDINNNVSTAEDLLKLAEYAYKIPYIQQTSNQKYVIFQTDMRIYKAYNHNKLILENVENNKTKYEGLKTGFTKKAGPCLITKVKNINTNKQYLIIVLNNKLRWSIAKQISNI